MKATLEIFLSLPLAAMGPLPRLGLGPRRVPCVPQMGLLNMKGRHVQMANSACVEFGDKWPKLPKTEVILMNALNTTVYIQHVCKGSHVHTNMKYLV